MAIKTSIKEVKEVEKVQEETPFPKLMVSTVSNTLVFFHDSSESVVVYDEKTGGYFTAGTVNVDWDLSKFKDYVTVIDTQPEEIVEKELPFPKLMIAKDGDEIILFSKEEEGIVVYVTENSSTSLHYKGTCWEMSYFEDFKGELIVKNEKI
jgi:hypothetical protein